MLVSSAENQGNRIHTERMESKRITSNYSYGPLFILKEQISEPSLLILREESILSVNNDDFSNQKGFNVMRSVTGTSHCASCTKQISRAILLCDLENYIFFRKSIENFDSKINGMFAFPRQQLAPFWIALLFGMVAVGESRRGLFSPSFQRLTPI